MALDTREKRASAVHIGLPWRGALPLPDASITQPDRQQLGLLYAGILADGPTVIVTSGVDSVTITRLYRATVEITRL